MRLIQTVNSNQEARAFNNNTKFSVNALLNANKQQSGGDTGKNSFVNNFKSNINGFNALHTLNHNKMGELIRPILSQRQPIYSAKAHKLVTSKTSASLTLNENQKSTKTTLEKRHGYSSYFIIFSFSHY